MEEIQEFLNSFSGTSRPDLSFSEMMEHLANGNLSEILKTYTEVLKRLLCSELTTNGELIAQIVVLALIGALFSGFAGIFGSGHVSETGFYVVYLLTMTFLSASFFASIRIAADVTKELLGFMQVLLPAYFQIGRASCRERV